MAWRGRAARKQGNDRGTKTGNGQVRAEGKARDSRSELSGRSAETGGWRRNVNSVGNLGGGGDSHWFGGAKSSNDAESEDVNGFVEEQL